MLTRVTFGLLAWAAQASGRGPTRDAATMRTRGADSARIARAARAAQTSFELRRRTSVPIADEGHVNVCDARVGRFCYWHDDGVQPRHVDEPPAIIHARVRLLETLDASARLIPSDGWIAGQRVRYWVEADRVDSAIAAARACGAESWWCHALEAFALHEGTRFGEADSVFALSIAEMPRAEMCRWTDISLLLDGKAADRYDHASCDDRQALNERVWWLAQPFYSLGANDLRTEHYARMTMVRLSESASWPQDTPWSDDLRELIVRYGWPRWFTRARTRDGTAGPTPITGHEPEPSFAFIPDPRLLDSALSASDADWGITSRTARTNYAPAYTIAVTEPPHQVARFVRGDSTLLVAAYDAAGDTLLARGDLRAALMLAPDERSRFGALLSRAQATGTLTVTGPRRPALASIELLAADTRASARFRFAVAPIDVTARIAVSDVLLYNPAGAAPRNLNDVLSLARASTQVEGESAVGLYWEVYGLREGGEPIRVSLTIARTNESWWWSARRALHLTKADAPIVLGWSEVAVATDGVAGRAVSVDLSRLSAGRYRLRIEVSPETGSPVVTERELELVR